MNLRGNERPPAGEGDSGAAASVDALSGVDAAEGDVLAGPVLPVLGPRFARLRVGAAYVDQLGVLWRHGLLFRAPGLIVFSFTCCCWSEKSKCPHVMPILPDLPLPAQNPADIVTSK